MLPHTPRNLQVCIHTLTISHTWGAEPPALPPLSEDPQETSGGKGLAGKAVLLSLIEVARLCRTPSAAASQTSPTRRQRLFPPRHHPGKLGGRRSDGQGQGKSPACPQVGLLTPLARPAGPRVSRDQCEERCRVLEPLAHLPGAHPPARCAPFTSSRASSRFRFLICEMLLKIDLPEPPGHRKDGKRKQVEDILQHLAKGGAP